MLDVVGREPSKFGTQGTAAKIGQLVRMQLDRQAQRTRSFENATGLRRRESDRFAEGIDGIGKAALGHRRQHFRADQVDVGILAAGKFGRNRMRAEEGGAHVDPRFLANSTCHPQHLEFVFQTQSIPGLDFQGGYAIGDQRACARHGCSQQRIVIQGAGLAYRRCNASACAGDGFITCPLQAQIEFVRAVSAKHQMGVAVDQSRCEQSPPRGFDPRRQGLWRVGQGGHRISKYDEAVLPANGCVFDQAQTLFAGKGGQMAIDD